MAGQSKTSFKKDHLSTFHIPLPDYPVACKIDNVSLLSELLFDRAILAFGRYDLIFCLQNRKSPSHPPYDTAIVTRTFCEQIQLTRPLTALRELTEVQACFGRPLHVRIRAGKPARLSLWDLLKSLITGRTWVEAQVEGQIAADILASSEFSGLELEIEEAPPQAGVDTTVEQDNRFGRQPEADAELKALAELAQKVISRYEGERAAREEAKCREPDALPKTPQPDATPPSGQGKPGAADMSKMTETVLDILRTHEAARTGQEQGRLQYPPGTERQASLNALHLQGQTAHAPAAPPPGRPADPFQIPLEQIASRPGLERFIRNPPPKPPGAGG